MQFRLLRANEIDCRISSVGSWGVQLLLYKDARVDMNILDEVFGTYGWQRKHELINGNLFCSVGIYDDKSGQWIWKQDVGVESYTEKEKGQASDAFKRACFNIGIGRELYTAPSIFVRPDELRTLKEENGKWTCKDFFKVKDISYEDRTISGVTILNLKTYQEIIFGEIHGTIGKNKAHALNHLLIAAGQDASKFAEYYKVSSLEELTESQYTKIVEGLKKRGNNRKAN